MTTDNGLRGISLNAPLALAILFGVAISASANDDLPAANNSVKVDAKPADAAAAVPRRQVEDKSGPEHIDGVAEFIPRVGRCTYKIKRGWTGWLVNGQTFQGISWGIADTQGIGVTSNRTEDKIAMFPGTDPVLDIINIGDYCKFVAVRKGTATIRYLGQGKDGNVRCEMQIEVEADTSEIDAALKEAIPQSQIKVTEVRSAALLTGTVPTNDDISQAWRVANQFYPEIICQVKVAAAQPEPSASPTPAAKPQRDLSTKATKASPQKSKSGVRAELKELRSEVQGLRQDIRELYELLARRGKGEERPQFELPKKASQKEFKVLRNGLLCFDATWCGPCQQMRPIISKLMKENHPIQTIDVDANPEICRDFKVDSIPTFVLMKDWEEIERVTGLTTEAQLKKLLLKLVIDESKRPKSLSTKELRRELSLLVGEAKDLTFDQPVTAILPSKADVVVIEQQSPNSARIRGRITGDIELQLVYRDPKDAEWIRVSITDDPLTRALSKTVALNVDNQPLDKVIQDIGRLIDANILLDTRALEAAGVSPTTKQTFVITGVSARTALRLILKPLHLDVLEDNEIIIVTDAKRANGTLGTCDYDVSDLVKPNADPALTTTGPQLVELVLQLGSNDCWQPAGGVGTVVYQEDSRKLRINQTYIMHHRVGRLLADLRRRNKEKAEPAPKQERIDSQASRFIEERLGVVLVPLTREEAFELPPSIGQDGTSAKWQGGLRVTEIKQPHLLRKKDVIVGINTSSVSTFAELATALDRFEKSSMWPKDPLTGEPARPKKQRYSSRPQSTITIQVISDGQIRSLDFTLLNSLQDREATEHVVRVYSVADLVPPVPTEPNQGPAKPDWFRLIDLIVAEVEPTCWKLNGGECSIVTNEKTLSLVIRAPQHIQDQVTTVLARERRKLDIQVSFSVRMITAPDKALDLTGIDLSLKTDPEANCALLNAAEQKIVSDAFEAAGAEMLYAPKITVFNGATAHLRNGTWKMKDGTSIDVATQLRGLVAPDRRSVGVNLALNADKVVEELTRRTINVADGSSLLLDVTEELRSKNPTKTITGRAYMLIEPTVIVIDEEEARLEAPKQGRVSMKIPRGITVDEEEALSSPRDLAK